MSDAVIGALIGVGGLTAINVGTFVFFYGKMCGRFDGLEWRVDRLWGKVFNGSNPEVQHESRKRG